MNENKNGVTSEAIRKTFRNCYDFSVREIAIGGENGTIMATVCYIDGLVSGTTVAETIIKPATNKARFSGIELESDAIEHFMRGGVYSYTSILRTKLDDVVDDMLCGFCAVIFDAAQAAVTFEVRSPDKRSIDEPKE